MAALLGAAPHFLNTTMLAVMLSQPMPRASLGFLARQASSSSWQMTPASTPRSSRVLTNSTACLVMQSATSAAEGEGVHHMNVLPAQIVCASAQGHSLD